MRSRGTSSRPSAGGWRVTACEPPFAVVRGIELTGAVVAITGASAGIGRASALAFARAGSRLALAARRVDRLEQLAAEVRGLGSEAIVMQTDVASASDVRRFVAAAVERWGRLDVMVNNAGYGVRGRVEETPVEDYRRLMEVNFLGTVHGTREALAVMRGQGRGVIINVSSIVGHRALAGGAAYAATKAAQVSLTESLRLELRGTGIAACSVHPIATDTEFSEVAERASAGRRGGPLGPKQSAEAVARAIVACARRPRPEVYPHRLSRAIVWLNALAPGLVERLIARATRPS
jgi:NADP-dependent 3-hydroxy acid dehydrogenase YdfG